MIYKDIVTKRTYTKNGEEKTIWLNVGTLRVTDEGKEFLELNMYPNTPFYVFEKKQNDDKKFEEHVEQIRRTSPTPEYPDGIDVTNHPLVEENELDNIHF